MIIPTKTPGFRLVIPNKYPGTTSWPSHFFIAEKMGCPLFALVSMNIRPSSWHLCATKSQRRVPQVCSKQFKVGKAEKNPKILTWTTENPTMNKPAHLFWKAWPSKIRGSFRNLGSRKMSSPHKKLGLKVSFPFTPPENLQSLSHPSNLQVQNRDGTLRRLVTDGRSRLLCKLFAFLLRDLYQRRDNGNETANGNDVFPFTCWDFSKNRPAPYVFIQKIFPQPKKKRWPTKKSI